MGRKFNVEIEVKTSGFKKEKGNCSGFDKEDAKELSKVFSGEDFKF